MKNCSKVLIVANISVDIERTLYVLRTAVAQSYNNYELLVLGCKPDVHDYEKIFEVLNYGIDFDRCKIVLFNSKISELYRFSYSYFFAKKKQCNYVCFLPENIALYDSDSLENLMHKKRDIGFVIGRGITCLDDEVDSTNCEENYMSTLILYNIKKLKLNEKIACQRVIKSTQDKSRAKDRIKIAFLVSSYSIWSSMKTVYESALQNDRCIVDLIYVRSIHTNENDEKIKAEQQDYTKAGYALKTSENYNIINEKPDIVVTGLPYSTREAGFNIDDIEKIGARCVYLPYGMVFETNWPELIRLRYRIAMFYLAWMTCYNDEEEAENARKNYWGNKESIYVTGSPRIDLLKRINANSYSEYKERIIKKANGRTIALWNTHHSIESDEMSFSSWKKFGESIIKYIKNNNEMFFIWRPHPYFPIALKKYLGEKKYESFMNEINKIENLIIDDEESYLKSFSVSDFFISDASSMAKEYLFLDKPVIVTVSDKKIVSSENIEKCTYVVDNYEKFETACNSLKAGKDIKSQNRRNYIDTYVNSKESVGEKIVNLMLLKYDSE